MGITDNANVSDKKHIVVIGGGFAGLSFCRNFKHPQATVTLIDRRNHHLFIPLLYQVATTGLSAPDIAQPLRSLFSKRDDFQVLLGEVNSIDLEQKRLDTTDGVLDYDYLVIAAGSDVNFFGNDNWAKHAAALKSLPDAHYIRNNVLRCFEKAASNSITTEERRRLMTTVIIGAGPTGLEMAGALAELYRRVFRRDYPRIHPEEAQVILVDANSRVLRAFSEESSQAAQKQLEDMGVQIITGKRVRDLRDGEVVLDDRTIQAGMIIWAAGVAANSLTRALDVPKTRNGSLQVEKDCSLPDHREVFAVGDIVSLEDANGRPVPGLAPAAIQMGKHLAENLERELAGKDREPFRYRDKGMLATIGRARAVGEVRGKRFSGVAAWFVWLAVHLAYLIGMENRLAVLLQWFFSYVTFRPGARILWEERSQ